MVFRGFNLFLNFVRFNELADAYDANEKYEGKRRWYADRVKQSDETIKENLNVLNNVWLWFLWTRLEEFVEKLNSIPNTLWLKDKPIDLTEKDGVRNLLGAMNMLFAALSDGNDDKKLLFNEWESPRVYDDLPDGIDGQKDPTSKVKRQFNDKKLLKSDLTLNFDEFVRIIGKFNEK